ncbi:MAG: DUF2817 domain-containing protein [Agathobacter sp.]|nr:DUF2817 domain-containing protein [Agathobacter sp.]
MKKNLLLIIGAVVLVLLLLCTAVGPQLILMMDKQEAVAKEYRYSDVFYDEYEDVRMHLLDTVDTLKADGHNVQLSSYAIDEKDDLYIDTIYIPATEKQTNLIVITTGVHGIEGYIGSVMLDVFWKEIYSTEVVNAANTGVMIVANVNPYGMKYHRRYNENNVDLNRNFILDWESFDMTVNKDYPKVDTFLGPQSTLGNAFWHEAGFYGSLVVEVIQDGADTISNALLGGQYEYPEGVYYGGNGDESSTKYLKDVFKQTLESEYENIVHIDVHSGYGPRYNMVIFNSVFETMNEAESVQLFGYDNVIAHDSEAFYPTTGDTTDYYYRLHEQMGTDKGLFSTCFEFGTIGDSFLDSIISMKYTIEENQNHWYPSSNKTTNEIVKERYQELFYPTEKEWREKTIADFATACKGVLKAKLITE